MRRFSLTALLALALALLAASGAGAVVVDTSSFGQTTSSPYNSSATTGYAGVALIPAVRNTASQMTNQLQLDGFPNVVSSGACLDPALSFDLWWKAQPHLLPDGALCSHGGGLVHRSETFDLLWDPLHRNWTQTRQYVEQYLRNIADASGSLSSPYAVTQQYTDAGGRAAYDQLYGGGCIDQGASGGSCQINGNIPGPGHSYPATNGCQVGGPALFAPSGPGLNDVCLSDAQIQTELRTMIEQEGLIGKTKSGYSPLLVLMTPAGVEDCLGAAGTLCSANGYFAPPQPNVSSADTGGAIGAGTYQVVVTYATAGGETLASAPTTVTTTGTSSTITIDSPPAPSGLTVTGWNAYIAPVGAPYSLQGGVNSLGGKLELAEIQSGGAAPSHVAFCSYHSAVDVNGTMVPYVVQPWTPLTDCDEPDAPVIPQFPPTSVLEQDIGIRLVSPISQSQIAALVNPNLNGWFAQDGSEIDDNGCVPLGHNLDVASVGSTTYLLQHEFNNAGTIAWDPFAWPCAGGVTLDPTFVPPSAVKAGDVVEFDGSKTATTLLVPAADYEWNFGDGRTAIGPSANHIFKTPGTYTVTLTVTDRGGNVRSTTETVQVLGAGPNPPPHLTVHMQLLPQSLRSMLRRGVAMLLASNQAGDALVTLTITRGAALRGHLHVGHAAAVVIGRGTISGIRKGTMSLHVHLPRAVAAKLQSLGHVMLTVRLQFLSLSGGRLGLVAAGRY